MLPMLMIFHVVKNLGYSDWWSHLPFVCCKSKSEMLPCNIFDVALFGLRGIILSYFLMFQLSLHDSHHWCCLFILLPSTEDMRCQSLSTGDTQIYYAKECCAENAMLHGTWDTCCGGILFVAKRSMLVPRLNIKVLAAPLYVCFLYESWMSRFICKLNSRRHWIYSW